MQFGPQEDEKLRKPAANGSEAMNTGVASGAQSNQQIDAVQARHAMVNGQLPFGRAVSARLSVSGEHRFPETSEGALRELAATITLSAKPLTHRGTLSAGAKQRPLPGPTAPLRAPAGVTLGPRPNGWRDGSRGEQEIA